MALSEKIRNQIPKVGGEGERICLVKMVTLISSKYNLENLAWFHFLFSYLLKTPSAFPKLTEGSFGKVCMDRGFIN